MKKLADMIETADKRHQTRYHDISYTWFAFKTLQNIIGLSVFLSE